ncbi:MAG: response regulator transcription factor [Anaerolineae bacterium]
MAHKILVVDDEDTLRYFLRLNLQDEGYNVSDAANGATALRLIDHNQFDVALIDLHLADMNGLEIVRYLRKNSPDTSVIILTGYATVDSAVEALRQGAHDYLTKPYKNAELLSSVADGVARRSARPAPPGLPPDTELLAVKDITLNRAARRVERAGEPVNLTPTEFDILAVLMRQPDTAVDAATLVKEVRGYEASAADASAIARVHIHRLRHKIEKDPANPAYIQTVAGGRYLITGA